VSIFMEHAMKTHFLPPTLLLTAMLVSPASANWFSNPSWGLNLEIGSARSPTPEDIRAGRQPMLVKDADGNVIAMIDMTTGKIIATAEPPAGVSPPPAAAPAKPTAAPVRAANR
jgi:hypothetical protein